MRGPTRLRPAALPLLLLLPLCAAGGLLGGGCSAAGAELAPVASEPQVLPSERWKEFFLLPLDFGGDPERRLWFVFDTGANVTLVDPDALAAVSEWRGGAGSGVNLVDMRCGPITWNRLPASTRELDHLSRALGRPLDGILGYPAMRDVLLTLDYGAGEVRVAEGALPPPDGEQVFALRNTGNRRPWVSLEAAGRRHTVLVDSGSTGSLSLRSFPEAGWELPPLPVGTSMGIHGLEFRHIGRAAGPVTLLGQDFEAPLVRIEDDTELVGTLLLRHFVLTFDQRRHRVRVERLSGAPVPPEPLVGTGLLTEPLPDGLLVRGLTPGSPAERAGVRVGDRVVGISGTPFDARRDGGFEPLRDGEREFHRYRLLREGQELELEVDLVDLLPAPAESGA